MENSEYEILGASVSSDFFSESVFHVLIRYRTPAGFEREHFETMVADSKEQLAKNIELKKTRNLKKGLDYGVFRNGKVGASFQLCCL